MLFWIPVIVYWLVAAVSFIMKGRNDDRFPKHHGLTFMVLLTVAKGVCVAKAFEWRLEQVTGVDIEDHGFAAMWVFLTSVSSFLFYLAFFNSHHASMRKLVPFYIALFAWGMMGGLHWLAYSHVRYISYGTAEHYALASFILSVCWPVVAYYIYIRSPQKVWKEETVADYVVHGVVVIGHAALTEILLIVAILHEHYYSRP